MCTAGLLETYLCPVTWAGTHVTGEAGDRTVTAGHGLALGDPAGPSSPEPACVDAASLVRGSTGTGVVVSAFVNDSRGGHRFRPL